MSWARLWTLEAMLLVDAVGWGCYMVWTFCHLDGAKWLALGCWAAGFVIAGGIAWQERSPRRWW